MIDEKGYKEPTPGNWWTDTTNVQTRPNGMPYLSIYGDGFEIAQVNGNGAAQSKHNALIMTASKDTLAALKALLIETDQHATGDCPKLKDACQQARAAIAKAEGR